MKKQISLTIWICEDEMQTLSSPTTCRDPPKEARIVSRSDQELSRFNLWRCWDTNTTRENTERLSNGSIEAIYPLESNKIDYHKLDLTWFGQMCLRPWGGGEKLYWKTEKKTTKVTRISLINLNGEKLDLHFIFFKDHPKRFL